jgi:N-acetyl-alpha-D-glucosaminyl L-malate synthase BshA
VASESKLKLGISCLPIIGGSGAVATELGKKLAELGHEVHFITRALPFRLLGGTHENISFHEVETFAYPTFQNPPYVMALASKMQEICSLKKLDFLHVHYALPHAVSAYLAKQMSEPDHVCVMTTLHGTDVTLVGMAPSLFTITKFSIESSDVVTTVSKFLRKQTQDIFSTEKRIHVVPNFVDPERFKPMRDRRRTGLLKGIDKHIIMHVSNFRPVKNIETVVKVFEEVRKRMPAHLVFVGDGPEQTRIEQMANEQGLETETTFLGNQERIEDLLPLADVFLLPSLDEGFGLAALEAMSCGVPVIATNNGGITEVIEDGKTGYLRDPLDVDGMADIAVKLLGDEELKRHIGASARERAANDYHVDDIVKYYILLYENWKCGT